MKTAAPTLRGKRAALRMYRRRPHAFQRSVPERERAPAGSCRPRTRIAKGAAKKTDARSGRNPELRDATARRRPCLLGRALPQCAPSQIVPKEMDMSAYELKLLAELIAIGVMEVAPSGKSVRPKAVRRG